MRRLNILILPLAALGLLVAVEPAAAQRDVALAAEYNFSAAEYNKEAELLVGLDKQIGGVTDLVKGCGLLDEKLTHLKLAEDLLGRMERSAKDLKRRKENESAANLRKNTLTAIDVTQADITRLCSSLPTTS